MNQWQHMIVPTFIWWRSVSTGSVWNSRRGSVSGRPRGSGTFSRDSSRLGRSLRGLDRALAASFQLQQNFLPEKIAAIVVIAAAVVVVVVVVEGGDRRARVCRGLSSWRVSRRFSSQRRLQHSLFPLQKSFHWFFTLKRKKNKTVITLNSFHCFN